MRIEPNSPEMERALRWRAWLTGQLRMRDWSQSKLAEAIGVYRTTANKWLQEPWTDQFRYPSYQSAVAMADVFGVDPDFVLRLAGLAQDEEEELTTLQRDVIAIVPHIPDQLLVGVYHQLRTLLDPAVQATALGQIGSREHDPTQERDPLAEVVGK